MLVAMEPAAAWTDNALIQLARRIMGVLVIATNQCNVFLKTAFSEPLRTTACFSLELHSLKLLHRFLCPLELCPPLDAIQGAGLFLASAACS